MFNSDKGRSLVILLFFIMILCVAIGLTRMNAVSAQGNNEMPGMMGGIGGDSSIAASDGFVYVVSDGKLSMFNTKTLKLFKSVDLMPAMNLVGMPGMNGNGAIQR